MIKEIIEAFCDLMDGIYPVDIEYQTGLPKKRCLEIYNIYKKLSLSLERGEEIK